MAHFVYILHSKKLNRFYIGESSNIEKRLSYHENSENRKFTSKADDWELFFQLSCEDKIVAKQIETHIKRMKSSIYIRNLKKYSEISEKLLQKYRK